MATERAYITSNEAYTARTTERVSAREDAIRIERARNKMAALAYVNQIRNDLRLGSLDVLSAGSPAKARECVVSRSVRVDAPRVYASTSGGGGTYRRMRWGFRMYNASRPLPLEVSRFIVDFDMGYYPELVKSSG